MVARIDEETAKALFISNDLKPLVPWINSVTPWKSKCLRCHKTVSPTYNKVRLRGHQCKYCSSHGIDENEATKKIETAGFTAIVDYPGSGKPWKMRCNKCGKITSPTYSNIKKGTGCKYCSKRAVDPIDAENAMNKRGFKTLEKYPGATKPWKVECLKCKKTFYTTFHSFNRTRKCIYCTKHKVEESDLLLILKDLKLKPLEPYKSAKTPWKCLCLICKHQVQPTWNRIKQGRGHCAYCARRRVFEPDAIQFMVKLNLKPLIPFPGSNKPWLSKCLSCGQEAKPRWSDLNRGQGGCSNCADFGLNYGQPGYLYLIHHKELHAHKIGIANLYKTRKTDDRMYNHTKRGWVLYKKVNFETLEEAANVEKEILKWLRLELGLPFTLTPKQMPQGGWTETVSSEDIGLKNIWEKVLDLSKH
jgi:hypothetical protein